MNVVKSIVGMSWSAHPLNILNIYKTWIRPVLEYGCPLLLDARSREIAILECIQFASLRVALELLNTTPTNVILDLAGEFPLQYRFEWLTKEYIVKCISSFYFIFKVFDFCISPLGSGRLNRSP